MNLTDKLADALDCFWNASMSAARRHDNAAVIGVVGSMAEGFTAVANRLREPDVVAPLRQPVRVSDDMIERACKRYAFREDGAAFPDDYSEYEVLAERKLMRDFLTYVLESRND